MAPHKARHYNMNTVRAKQGYQARDIQHQCSYPVSTTEMCIQN